MTRRRRPKTLPVPHRVVAPAGPPDPLVALGESLPLAHTWRCFVHFRSEPGCYKASLATHGDPMLTIADFWRTFNNMPAPSAAFTPPCQLGVHGRAIKAYSLFLEGVHPAWEDPVNAVGGELCCRCYLAPEVLDELWLAVVLACVGGTMPECVVGVRGVDNTFRGAPTTQSKIEIWFSPDTPENYALVRTGLAAALAGGIGEPCLGGFEIQTHAEKSTMENKFMSSLKRRTAKQR